jgi:hypothetical protein
MKKHHQFVGFSLVQTVGKKRAAGGRKLRVRDLCQPKPPPKSPIATSGWCPVRGSISAGGEDSGVDLQ